MTLICPNCSSSRIKKNGHIHNGKQNHQCLQCGRQFILNPEQKIINRHNVIAPPWLRKRDYIMFIKRFNNTLRQRCSRLVTHLTHS